MEIGVDLTTVSRFNNIKKHFIKRMLTDIEYDLYLKCKKENRTEFLAARWAVKEAIFKANNDIGYLHYSLLHKENGKPYILDHPEIKVSLSHEKDTLIALVLIETK